VTSILVPYHIDEYLPELDVPDSGMTLATALPDGDLWSRLRWLYGAVAATVSTAVTAGDRPVVFSGDCTTALGTVAGLQRAGVDPTVVWFDAHGDVQTLETTTSGYVGGMPLRMLTGYRPELIAESIGLRPVPESMVLLTDGRDLDPPEADYLRAAEIRRCPVSDLAPSSGSSSAAGTSSSLTTSSGDIPGPPSGDRVGAAAGVLPDGPIYLHFDVDVVDPIDLPGLRFPAPHGPDLATVTDALIRVIDTGRVVAIGVACTWDPGHGTAARLAPLIKEIRLRMLT